ncbi:hypothetical protein ACMA5I_10330 [Paracoccaceae bacterium GXU_MW_L88]
MDFTGVNKEEWTESLQEFLEEPKLWKEVFDVMYTSTKTFHMPYFDQGTATSYNRGSQYTRSVPESVDDIMVINDSAILPYFIDRADLAQNGYIDEVEMAREQGIALDEQMQRQIFTDIHANATDFDDGNMGGTGGTAITVTGGAAGNIGDLFRKARTAIASSKGGLKALNSKKLMAIVPPEIYEHAVSYAQANGFQFADTSLESGKVPVINGFKIYESNLLDTTTDSGSVHCIFGVNKAMKLGILNTTFGQVVTVDDPDNRSGVGVTSRVDYGVKLRNNDKEHVLDVLVATS